MYLHTNEAELALRYRCHALFDVAVEAMVRHQHTTDGAGAVPSFTILGHVRVQHCSSHHHAAHLATHQSHRALRLQMLLLVVVLVELRALPATCRRYESYQIIIKV